MNELWNFKDALVVAQANLMWLLAALALGIVVGWITCVRHNEHIERRD